MPFMDPYDSHRLSEPRGWNDDVVTPDEVRIPLDEFYFGKGEQLISLDDCWVVVGGYHDQVVRFETDARLPADVRPSIAAVVADWLATPNGQKAIQRAIDDAMEDAE
jgi:hypothetical protein